MEGNIICHQRGKDPLYKTWHASNEHLFMYIYSDGGSIVCGKRVFPIKEGALVFIAAGAYHYTMPDSPAIYDRSKLTILPQKFSKIMSLMKENEIIRSFGEKAFIYAEIDNNDRRVVDSIFDEIKICKNSSECELILISCLLRILYFLNKYSVESTPSSTGFLGKAIEYINENISSDIDIDSVCCAINISKYYFCRQFKEHTGMTVMNYILKTRIVLAKNELKKTDLSITEVSEKYNFSSVSYFCRVFKEEENCTPLQYRKMYR